MKIIFLLVLVAYGIQSFAQSQDICQMSSEDFQKRAMEKDSRIGFRNFPGPMKTGVCWWHSRLQRSALYLAVFDQPNAPKPSQSEVMQILEKIAQNKSVVIIPGFTNWLEFSKEYENEVKFYLGRWEMTDTVQLEFRKGMRLNQGTPLSEMKNIAKEVNEYKRIAYVMVDLPLGAAHAWLIPKIDLKSEELWYIDSNYSLDDNIFDFDRNYHIDIPSWRIFARGSKPIDKSKNILNTEFSSDNRTMSLVLQNEKDYPEFARAIYRHCKKETPFTYFEWQIKRQKRRDFLNSLVGR